MNATYNPEIFIVLIVILMVIVMIVIRLSKRERAMSDYHSRPMRILCAILLAAGLVAVGIGTWRECMAAKPIAEITINVPTRSPRPIPATGRSQNHVIDIGPCRLIATVMLVSRNL